MLYVRNFMQMKVYRQNGAKVCCSGDQCMLKHAWQEDAQYSCEDFLKN